MNKFITAAYVAFTLVIGLTMWIIGIYMGGTK